jgi:hypothetical protein
MSYTYRSRPSPDQQAELRRQKLELGILAYRKATTSICPRFTALRAQRDQEIAQAICDGLATRAVAVTAAPVGGAKQSGLSREGGLEGIEEYLYTQYIGITDPYAG